MLTDLFKLVWNRQKSAWTNIFEYQSKMFFNIENGLVTISEGQPYMHCVIVLLHIFKILHIFKGVKILLTCNMRNVTEQNGH